MRYKKCQISCILGVSCCIFVFQAEDDFKNKKETFKPKPKQIIYSQKATYVYKTSNSTHHPVPTETQRFPDRFSFGSR